MMRESRARAADSVSHRANTYGSAAMILYTPLYRISRLFFSFQHEILITGAEVNMLNFTV